MNLFTREKVEEKIQKMGYRASFTIFDCDEDGEERRFCSGTPIDDQLFLESDTGDEIAHDNDFDEVLHVRYWCLTFGEGDGDAASDEDLAWIEENFDVVQAACSISTEGYFSVLNPYFEYDWEEYA